MWRHDSLRDLSRDHFEALVHAQRLRRAVDKQDAAAAMALRGELLRYWDGPGRLHFDEEESIWLPWAQQHRPLRALAAKAQADHAALDVALADVRAASADGVFDAFDALRRPWVAHVRWEEGVLFEQMQRLPDETGLRRIGNQSRQWRISHRGQAFVGLRGARCEAYLARQAPDDEPEVGDDAAGPP